MIAMDFTGEKSCVDAPGTFILASNFCW